MSRQEDKVTVPSKRLQGYHGKQMSGNIGYFLTLSIHTNDQNNA